MKAYQIVAGQGIDNLRQVERPLRDPQPHEILVRVRAVSLNFRDLMVARGDYLVSAGAALVPGSDAAGEVIAIGSAVKRYKVGDRVMSIFFPNWLEGAPTPEKTAVAPGGNADGVLATHAFFDEQAAVRIPAHLDFNEAATLTCAGVTAWNSLFVEAKVQAGDTVLLLGTGGVSIWGLQLAKAAGLRTIITSSSDAKLERARALGASETINYKKFPEWDKEVLKLTAGLGVNMTIEVGGAGTLAHSVASTKMGGTIAIVGGVSGFSTEFQPFALIGGARRLSGIYVGSRQMFENMTVLIELTKIRPVVDRVFEFDQAAAAYRHLDSGQHFGKVVISAGE